MNSTGRNNVKQKVIAAFVLTALAAFAVFSNGLIVKLNGREGYPDWLKTETEPKVLIINVWHIVSFKPYIGSIGSWLKSRAEEYKKGLVGIHFEVRSLTPYQAQQLLLRGLRPDVVSFSYGDCSSEALYALDGCIEDDPQLNLACGRSEGKQYALPYCASGYVLLYDPIKCSDFTDEELINNAGTAAEFKKGKVESCVCDLKAAGDVYRAELAGGAPYFEAKALPFDSNAGELIQFIGVSNGLEAQKLKYAVGFIR